jgi:hypothetical protein
MQIINNVFEQRAERKSKTFARLCYSTPTVPGTVGVVSNVEHRGHRKKWRTPGFRSPYQPSQHKFSGTHTGVERREKLKANRVSTEIKPPLTHHETPASPTNRTHRPHLDKPHTKQTSTPPFSLKRQTRCIIEAEANKLKYILSITKKRT